MRDESLRKIVLLFFVEASPFCGARDTHRQKNTLLLSYTPSLKSYLGRYFDLFHVFLLYIVIEKGKIEKTKLRDLLLYVDGSNVLHSHNFQKRTCDKNFLSRVRVIVQ